MYKLKLLVIGMDGAHFSALTRGWTPFIEDLISNGQRAELHEDLVGRGWAKIIMGKCAP